MYSARLFAAILVVTTATHVFAQEIVFRHVFDKSPLDVSPKAGEVLTDQVKEFRKSGQNPYKGNADAIAQGKKLYGDFCASCHLPDGSGRMGPSLIEDYHVHDEIKTDVGMFEVVFGGRPARCSPSQSA